MKFISKAILISLSGLCMAALPVRAVYLLRVDVTDPTAVSITATGMSPTNTDIQPYYAGVTLVNFFTAETYGSGAINYDPAPTLSTYLNPVTYVIWESDRYIAGAYVDLNLIYPQGFPPGDQPQPLISAYPAFAGTSYLNLSGNGLPSNGAHGPIYLGNAYFHDSAGPIGEWVVVGPVQPPTLPPGLPDPSIVWPGRISPTQFGFSINGTNGANYTVQYKTNVASTNWTDLTSFQLTTNPFPIVDLNATNNVRYYRVRKN